MLNKAELLTAFPDGLYVQNGPSRVWLGVAALEAVQAELHRRERGIERDYLEGKHE